jgi:enoyl-CoA hydratase/carnithine racemase
MGLVVQVVVAHHVARLQFCIQSAIACVGSEANSVIAQSVSWIRQREDVRAVVVINPEVLTHVDADRRAEAWRTIAVPVVTAVRGLLYGYGLLTALEADVRFAALDARLSFAGIKPQAALRMLGDQLSLRQIDSIRPFVLSGDAFASQQAVSAGLVSRAGADPLVLAEEAAQEICRHDPDHVRNVKQLLNRSGEMSYGDCVAAELNLHRRSSRPQL